MKLQSRALAVMALAVLAFAAIATLPGASAGKYPPPHRKAPPPKKPAGPTAYRLISITKWNATANTTDLQAAEVSVSLACKEFFVAGITGCSEDQRASPLWGSHIKIYDFPSAVAYTNYSQCVAKQPGRAYSQPFEVWKNRAFFPYTESVADATAGTLWSASIANVTDRAAAVGIFNDYSSQVASLLALSQAAETWNGVVAAQLDVSHVLSVKKPQGLLAIGAYSNEAGAGGLPPLDTLVQLAPIIKVLRRIAFTPTRLV
ncbi:hypothetical protein HYH02_010603 [Chlamydomonas schloesseri]|uniref:Uncharacterized protein n=1 Tax=Chlamydomonas schloesseri TaxID=2026947 RepID=A0A835TJ36_9CHLO|nr:hypothetical protein HYH02_010603 [Chlamydomonas schloesseri]|eukprot:KAG2439725.1 hypothetical protein HYH02_010603 [Chlamydomonas schloesseri]